MSSELSSPPARAPRAGPPRPEGRTGWPSLRAGPDLLCAALLLALAVSLWLPRLTGPLDLRYDAGVYYVLGSALAEGKGYRLLNEPGEIQAIQYPPLVPLAAALAQRVAGTKAMDRAGHLLRLAYFLCYLLYAAAVYLLARRFLPPAPALLVGLVTFLHEALTRISDAFFAELPYSAVGVVFALAFYRGHRRPWALAAGLLAVAAYLTRTMGLALLAAWVGEALLRRRWAGAARRALVALIPVAVWQGYVAHVKAGPEYEHPAYPYQRADYQYYNVGYLENVAYIDPFHPELGKASAADWAGRVAGNLVRMPSEWGYSLSAAPGWWRDLKYELDRRARRFGGLRAALFDTYAAALGGARIAIVALGGLAVLGLLHLAGKGELFIPLYAAGVTLLACLTPWPEQFLRYFLALTPFLAIGAMCVLVDGSRWARTRWKAGRRRSASFGAAAVAAGAALVAFGLASEAYSQLRLLKNFFQPASYTDATGRPGTQRLAFYFDGWRSYETALGWLDAHAGGEDVIGSQAPFWTYLKIGRKSVFPPAEGDPEQAQRLLDAVPVAYLVLDEMEFNEISAREAQAVVRAHPDRWQLAYESPDARTRVYRRRAGPRGDR